MPHGTVVNSVSLQPISVLIEKFDLTKPVALATARRLFDALKSS
jgi:hypothetical protein